MGVILSSENNLFVDQVLDTFLIFLLGAVMMYFFHTLINYPRTFLVSFAGYFIVMVVLAMIYINQLCTDDDSKNTWKKQSVNFISIYTICLNLLIIFSVSNKMI